MLFSKKYDKKSIQLLNGTEIFHHLYYDLPNIYPELPLFYKNALKINEQIAPIGSSDWHVFDGLGYCKTIVLSTTYSEEGILAAIKNGDTVVKTPDGQYYGKEHLIELVKSKEQLLFTDLKPNQLTQGLTFIFLLGLIVFYVLE